MKYFFIFILFLPTFCNASHREKGDFYASLSYGEERNKPPRITKPRIEKSYGSNSPRPKPKDLPRNLTEFMQL